MEIGADIDIMMCIRSILLGALIGTIVLMLPMGNAITGALLVKGLVSTGLYSVSNKEEIVLLTCTLVSILLLNTIKEVIDPALSGNEDIIGIHISGYRWECLEISILQQIKELVEVKIEGLLYGLMAGFVVINVLHLTTASINITWLVVPLLIYRIIINNKTLVLETKLNSFAYLILIAITVKVLNVNEYSESLLVCVYAFFFVPSAIQSLFRNSSFSIKKSATVKLHSKK